MCTAYQIFLYASQIEKCALRYNSQACIRLWMEMATVFQTVIYIPVYMSTEPFLLVHERLAWLLKIQ